MKSLFKFIVALAVASACKDSTAPAPVDPPAMVHVINNAHQNFAVFTVIIGSDFNHSAVPYQGESDTDRTAPLCLFTAQVAGERRFVEVAVAIGSSLDTFMRADHSQAFADSLAKGTLTPVTLLAAHPGLIAASTPFDPAPPGFAFPPDTVPWRWTVIQGQQLATIAVDTSDHACR